MKILYFSWLKSKTGISEEQIDDKNIKDINTLLKYISKKHPKLKKFINKKNIIRISVNMNYEIKNKKLNKGDEIALFPPVSGG